MKIDDAVKVAAEDRPILIAGPTASGKSALALAMSEAHGGVVVNADALQVYRRWHVLTARPGAADLMRATHVLYGHVASYQAYSVGHWLREVSALLKGADRLIIVGGSGLYLSALTEGLADIPPIPPGIRDAADCLDMDTLLDGLDPPTHARIDIANRARVQRAWEVLRATGTGLAAWQDRTAPPLLEGGAYRALLIDAPPDQLNPRIERRFDAMLKGGALDEVRSALPDFDPRRPADRAIGAAELAGYLHGELTLADARTATIAATRQYAKRQRTWFRKRMKGWQIVRF